MGKPDPPQPQDPKQTAAAQTATNIGTAIANQQMLNTNQVTPYGNLSFDQSGTYEYTDPLNGKTHEIPQYTATQTLSPEQQAILEQNQRGSLNLATLGANQSGRLDDLLSRPINTDALPARGDASSIRGLDLDRVGSGPNLKATFGDAGPVTREIADAGSVRKSYGTDFSEDRQRVEDALFERLNPQLDRDRDRLESRLASQGIRMGSEAYNSAMDDLGRNTNDARLTAVLGAGQEHSRLSDMEARRAGFENAAQGQAFGQNAEAARFANGAQAQAFGQEAARADFSNNAEQIMHANEVQGIAMGNAAATQEANSDVTRFDAANTSRNLAMQEDLTLRNQPINEIIALMSGSQIRDPSFVTPSTAQIPTTDYAGIQNASDVRAQQRYGQELGLWSDIVAGTLGAGASAARGGF